MTARKLVDSFHAWQEQHEALVLASVYETEGSTYSKAGAQMLIAANGDFQGMLSGGCLEGDLGERARSVLDTGQPQTVTYDLGQNDEELWGLGVGCDGLMRILLQPLHRENGYQPFSAMAETFSGDDVELGITVLQSSHNHIAAGSSLVTSGTGFAFNDIAEKHVATILKAAQATISTGRSQSVKVRVDGGEVSILASVLEPPPRILVLGAGLDAQPVVRFIGELGWRATVQDHRPAYIENGDFSSAEQVLCLPAAEVTERLNLDHYAAAIVMSHHLATDRTYLKLLAHSSVATIGLLGPRDRRRRLLDELGHDAEALAGRVQGPAGIDIGASGPAAIALSIVAQMHLDLMT